MTSAGPTHADPDESVKWILRIVHFVSVVGLFGLGLLLASTPERRDAVPPGRRLLVVLLELDAAGTPRMFDQVSAAAQAIDELGTDQALVVAVDTPQFLLWRRSFVSRAMFEGRPCDVLGPAYSKNAQELTKAPYGDAKSALQSLCPTEQAVLVSATRSDLPVQASASDIGSGRSVAGVFRAASDNATMARDVAEALAQERAGSSIEVCRHVGDPYAEDFAGALRDDLRARGFAEPTQAGDCERFGGRADARIRECVTVLIGSAQWYTGRDSNLHRCKETWLTDGLSSWRVVSMLHSRGIQRIRGFCPEVDGFGKMPGSWYWGRVAYVAAHRLMTEGALPFQDPSHRVRMQLRTFKESDPSKFADALCGSETRGR
mgnify:CR=1 FL=1